MECVVVFWFALKNVPGKRKCCLKLNTKLCVDPLWAVVRKIERIKAK